ncbi:MAG: RNA polymerase sigma factor [Deltaproteobacteria bacterium]|nr:RNA polymerase sigma factor [Deltaproteobacteria bacterium]
MNVLSNKREAANGREDLRLMQLVAANDRRAQRVLAHRLAGRVLRITQRLIQNNADSEDASQMALIEILQSAATFNGESSLERWADRITTRTAIRHARRQRKRPKSLVPLAEAEEVANATGHRELCEEVPRNVDKYLAQLPHARREVLVLKHVLGHTIEEIAQLTDTPLGTVKDRLIAARRHVRKMIQRDVAVGINSGSKTDD